MGDALARLLASATRLEAGWTCDTFEIDGAIVQVARTPHAVATLRHQLAGTASRVGRRSR